MNPRLRLSFVYVFDVYKPVVILFDLTAADVEYHVATIKKSSKTS